MPPVKYKKEYRTLHGIDELECSGNGSSAVASELMFCENTIAQILVLKDCEKKMKVVHKKILLVLDGL